MLGARGEYSFEGSTGNVPTTTLLGSAFRADETTVQLWHTTRRRRLSNTVDALVHQNNMSMYVQEEFPFSPHLRLQVGLRGDYFLFDVEDQKRDSAHTDISGYVQQTILNPKANLVFSPERDVDIFLDFGGGFHSNDARAVVTQPDARTLPRAWGEELGVTISPGTGFSFSAVAWGLDLQSELVYNGDDGTTEPSGRTRRLGLDFEGLVQVTGENIFNVAWNEAQFDTESRLKGEALPVSELHFTPGTPLSVKMKVEWSF